MSKLCVNCRHFIPAIANFDPVEYAKCGFRFTDTDPVLGQPRKQRMTYCSALRADMGDKNICGPAAQFYEPKQPEAVAA